VQHSLGLRADGTEVPATDAKVAAPRAPTKG